MENQLDLSMLEKRGKGTTDCYEKLGMIGEGTYGQVFKARDKRTGELVALKRIIMDKEKEGFPITAIREIKILKKLQHDNVMKLKEIITSVPEDKEAQEGNVFMVFEYMDHDLTGLRRRIKFTAPQVKCYMKQLLIALHYCHINNVLHRDVKASNLLINNSGILKLADFGLARLFSHDQTLTNRVVTLWYRPPELLLGSTHYDTAVDIWSVGCVFAELLGKPLFEGKDEADQIQLISKICGFPHEEIWPGVSKLRFYSQATAGMAPKGRVLREIFRRFDPHAVDLLDRMLTLDPAKRITAKAALDMEYFWSEPYPCDPSSLPKYESSHEYNMKHRQEQRPAQVEQYREQRPAQVEQHREQRPAQVEQQREQRAIQEQQQRAAHEQQQSRKRPAEYQHSGRPPQPRSSYHSNGYQHGYHQSRGSAYHSGYHYHDRNNSSGERRRDI